ncbi:MAG TPA: hypothetical protein VED40_09640 [Azospirillaceae bacterium]|nr:hypothetical protein [Azospirillaceae bacterium]
MTEQTEASMGEGRGAVERFEDAVTAVNPDVWLASALVVVVIRCLGGLI